ncbi:TniQ family protein [Paracoccus litorisediminis]|uniref:TniQ domain-containing protein n=1 Tax=Paracoccus litorisediminis TaxID=2006130 RepID=A0A844HM14_9RHOB|nr:TniQ family protein [Paracoccus litorisediminis]MTH60906.1 hypothetical protein [Paracoccus litorisediminis]
MSKLGLTVPPIKGETAFSLASRLAARNGVDFSEFLRDMGISHRALFDGTDAALYRLAELSDADAADLRRNTPQFEAGGRASLRGHVFPAVALRGAGIRGCRDCLEEDLGREHSEGAAIRGVWLLLQVTICLRHGRPLEPLWTEAQPIRRCDSAARFLELGDHDWKSLPIAEKREPTTFDIWLQERLEGKTRRPIWLDEFSLHAASLFCAELGRAAIATKLPKWKKLAPEDLWRPSSVGFDLCQSGEAGLLAALTQLQQMMGKPEDGPKKIFGNLHEMLAADPLPSELAPFRDFLRHHIETTWPLGPGEEILGEPVLKRRLHSVASAARATARPVAEVRSNLIAAGLLPEGSAKLPDEWAVFYADQAGALLAQIALNLSEKEFRQAFGLTGEFLDQLAASGPLASTRHADGSLNPMQGQALLDDLLCGAETVYVPMHHWTDIPTAARHLNCRLVEIIEMIRDGRLPRIGRHVQRQGFASILVDLASRPAGENPISGELFAVSQGIPKSEMLSFLHREMMTSRFAASPRAAGERRVLTSDDVAGFHRDFISYRKLGLAAGLDWAQLDAFLDENAVAPAAGCRRIYRRRDVSTLIAQR